MQMKNPLLHVGLKHEVYLLNLNHRKMSCSLALSVKERTRVVLTLSMLVRVSHFMFQFYINSLLFFLFVFNVFIDNDSVAFAVCWFNNNTTQVRLELVTMEAPY